MSAMPHEQNHALFAGLVSNSWGGPRLQHHAYPSKLSCSSARELGYFRIDSTGICAERKGYAARLRIPALERTERRNLCVCC